MPEALNDTFTTDGERYRFPAHPQMVSALGRALWNFLALEEIVVAVLYESGAHSLNDARSMMAGPKEKAMQALRDAWSRQAAPASVIEALDGAISAFGLARSEHRNALGHAHPFTAGYDDDGTYLPGLNFVTSTGSSSAADARALHHLAHQIEEAIDPVSAARSAVNGYTR